MADSTALAPRRTNYKVQAASTGAVAVRSGNLPPARGQDDVTMGGSAALVSRPTGTVTVRTGKLPPAPRKNGATMSGSGHQAPVRAKDNVQATGAGSMALRADDSPAPAENAYQSIFNASMDIEQENDGHNSGNNSPAPADNAYESMFNAFNALEGLEEDDDGHNAGKNASLSAWMVIKRQFTKFGTPEWQNPECSNISNKPWTLPVAVVKDGPDSSDELLDDLMRANPDDPHDNTPDAPPANPNLHLQENVQPVNRAYPYSLVANDFVREILIHSWKWGWRPNWNQPLDELNASDPMTGQIFNALLNRVNLLTKYFADYLDMKDQRYEDLAAEQANRTMTECIGLMKQLHMDGVHWTVACPPVLVQRILPHILEDAPKAEGYSSVAVGLLQAYIDLGTSQFKPSNVDEIDVDESSNVGDIGDDKPSNNEEVNDDEFDEEAMLRVMEQKLVIKHEFVNPDGVSNFGRIVCVKPNGYGHHVIVNLCTDEVPIQFVASGKMWGAAAINDLLKTNPELDGRDHNERKFKPGSTVIKDVVVARRSERALEQKKSRTVEPTTFFQVYDQDTNEHYWLSRSVAVKKHLIKENQWKAHRDECAQLREQKTDVFQKAIRAGRNPATCKLLTEADKIAYPWFTDKSMQVKQLVCS
jgi:hypothetical protein